MKTRAGVVVMGMLLFAGCSQDDGAGDRNVVDDPSCAFDGSACTLNVTVPAVDARATLDALRDFASSFPGRIQGSPTKQDAADDLYDRMSAAGLDVTRQTYGTGTDAGENIIGIKWGLDRDAWIVVGAHYDITEAAGHGTYDDGSGTAMTFMLGASFANVPTNRTIAFIAFDQEELGLVGSRHFVDSVFAGEFGENVHVDGMLDLDMVGITWPHPAHLIVWENSYLLTNKITALAGAIGMPADHVEFRQSRGGSSDGIAFMAAGIATAYMWSDWDEFFLPGGQEMPYAGGYVGSYPWWHKADTYETMLASAGDEATLQAGFQNVLDIASPLVAYMASTQFEPDPDDA